MVITKPYVITPPVPTPLVVTKRIHVRALPPTDLQNATGDWLIGPVGQHRDSDVLETTNFEVVFNRMMALDPEMKDWEVLDWTHWAVGWIEEIACRPGSPCAALQAELRDSLDVYPSLDDDLLAANEALADAAADEEDTGDVEDLNLEDLEDKLMTPAERAFYAKAEVGTHSEDDK